MAEHVFRKLCSLAQIVFQQMFYSQQSKGTERSMFIRTSKQLAKKARHSFDASAPAGIGMAGFLVFWRTWRSQGKQKTLQKVSKSMRISVSSKYQGETSWIMEDFDLRDCCVLYNPIYSFMGLYFCICECIFCMFYHTKMYTCTFCMFYHTKMYTCTNI